MLDVSASHDAGNKQGAIFLVNRSQTESVIADFIWQDRRAIRVDKAWQLTGSDPKEVNSWQNPERVTAKAIPVPTVDDDRATLTLSPLSFTVLTTCPA